MKVFISYRREGGAEVARLVKMGLEQRGFMPFLDVDQMPAGHFDESLLRRIQAAGTFVLILSPGALDRCGQRHDWLTREIKTAVESQRNIVPVVLPGFQFPGDPHAPLLARLLGADLSRYQCVHYQHAYFAAAIDKLAEYIQRPASGAAYELGRLVDGGGLEPLRAYLGRYPYLIQKFVCPTSVAAIYEAWAVKTGTECGGARFDFSVSDWSPLQHSIVYVTLGPLSLAATNLGGLWDAIRGMQRALARSMPEERDAHASLPPAELCGAASSWGQTLSRRPEPALVVLCGRRGEYGTVENSARAEIQFHRVPTRVASYDRFILRAGPPTATPGGAHWGDSQH